MKVRIETHHDFYEHAIKHEILIDDAVFVTAIDTLEIPDAVHLRNIFSPAWCKKMIEVFYEAGKRGEEITFGE